MNQQKSRPLALRALFNFLSFAPAKIIFLNVSSLLMGLSGVVGILLIISLAQLSGVDFQADQLETSPWGFLSYIAEWVNGLALVQSLEGILVIYAVLAVVLGAFTYYRTMLGVKLQQDYTKQKRLEIYNALLRAKWQYLSSTRSSEFLYRLGGQVQTMNGAAQQMIGLLHKLLTMMIYTAVMLAVNWQFTLMTFVCALVVGLILFPIRWSVRDAGERFLRGYQQIFRLLSEHLGSLKMIKSSGRERDFADKLRTASEELEQQQVRVTRAGAIISFANGVALAAGFGVMLYFAVTYLQIPVANFFLLLIIMSRLMPQVTGLQQSYLSIINSLPAYKDIEETLVTSTAMAESSLSDNTLQLGLTKQIEFKTVGFHYPDSPRAIITGLNLTIAAKQTLALVGPSGIGKTTMADLIVGLLSPTQGSILIDNKKLEGSLLGQWRRSVAYVTQDTYLFHDSIRNNLSWVCPGASDDEIWNAIETAALKDCISELPKGLDSVIGDRGVRLSGGERQRLSIARALLAKPELLVLDEATSALDNKNENLIHQALINMHGQITVIIIAHRETTIRHADQILNLSVSPPALMNMAEFKNSIAIG